MITEEQLYEILNLSKDKKEMLFNLWYMDLINGYMLMDYLKRN